MRFLILFFVVLFFPFASAHFVIGEVLDSFDGKVADGNIVILWKTSVGISDNATDIIGATGNSQTPNYFMIDCFNSLVSGCSVGDEVSVRVVNSTNNLTRDFSLIITSTDEFSGFSILPTIRINSLPNISYVFIGDDFLIPLEEIDLIPASNKSLICEAVVYDYDGGNLSYAAGVFFANDSSYEDSDSNRLHYTNTSCFINNSYGNANESFVSCGFSVLYYAKNTEWNCSIEANDFLISDIMSNSTYINPLISIGVDSSKDFGDGAATTVSDEVTINVTNYGNIPINLSLSGYAVTEGDGLAMSCSTGNISIDYQKYNLTSSNSGSINLPTFESLYTNSTSFPVVRIFNLAPREIDAYNEAVRETYWRIYIPENVSGSCYGNIVFGAVQSPGS